MTQTQYDKQRHLNLTNHKQNNKNENLQARNSKTVYPKTYESQKSKMYPLKRNCVALVVNGSKSGCLACHFHSRTWCSVYWCQRHSDRTFGRCLLPIPVTQYIKRLRLVAIEEDIQLAYIAFFDHNTLTEPALRSGVLPCQEPNSLIQPKNQTGW